MAGSGEGKSLAEEVISSHDSSEFTTCRKGIKNRDNSSDVLPHWFPVGGRETHCIWLLPCFFAPCQLPNLEKLSSFFCWDETYMTPCLDLLTSESQSLGMDTFAYRDRLGVSRFHNTTLCCEKRITSFNLHMHDGKG
jgi:hypothetical protein